MKKFFSIIGLLSLLGISFLYSENVTSVVKEYDQIMFMIKEESSKYNKDVVDGIIDGEYIIPGVCGRKVDINKSYREMRQIGLYNENFLYFKTIKPDNKLKDNMDKIIISGNPIKNMVSLIFTVENYDDLNIIKSIIEKYYLNITLFIDGYFFEEHLEEINNLLLKGVEIESSGYNQSYNNSSYVWMDNILKSTLNIKNKYCFNTSNNKECISLKNYIIEPIYINSNYFLNTKKNLNPGNMYVYPVNSNIVKEFDLIVDYILAKGLKITNLNELLKE